MYCVVDGDGTKSGMLFGIVCLLLWLSFNFYLLSTTADRNLVPAMAAVSDWLGLSPNVSGVTILAFANGAPDFFTAMAAFTGKSVHHSLGMGAVVGGGYFISALVLGCVALTQEFTLYRRPFIRDVVMYLISMILLFAFVSDNKIELHEAICLPAVYCVYVFFVVGGRYVNQNYLKPGILVQPESSKHEGVGLSGGEEFMVAGGGVDDDKNAAEDGSFVENGRQEIRATMSLEDNVRESTLEEINALNADIRALDESLLGGEIRRPNKPLFDCLDALFSGLRHFVGWEDRNCFWRLVLLVEFPIMVCQRATCPLVEEKTWNVWWSALGLVFAPQLLFFILDGWKMHLGWVWAIAILALGVTSALEFLWCTASQKELPTGRLKGVFIALAFVMSCVWTYLIANEVVGMLTVLGVVCRVSDAIMGVTLLAWGNGLGDLFCDVALAREGHPRMAAAGCFGGPIFNILVGTGIPFTIYTLTEGQPLELSKDDETNIGFLCLGITLIATIIIVPFNEYLLSRPIAALLIGMYFIFISLLVLIESGLIPSI